MSARFRNCTRDFPDLTFNELQLRLFANCERFVSVLGGASYLASYFGGTNIVYAQEGWEVDCKAYEGWFDRFSGARVIAARTSVELVNSSTSAEFVLRSDANQLVKTGSFSQPRTVDVCAWTALSQSTSQFGNRLSTSSSATRPSRRARWRRDRSGCRTRSARWWSIVRWMSKRSGSGKCRSSRLPPRSAAPSRCPRARSARSARRRA